MRRLEENLGKIRAIVALLDDASIWWRPNPRSNSVGNLILHLCGNLSQWVLAGLGGAAYERHRSREFTAEGTATGDELGRRLADVIGQAAAVIGGLSDEALAKRYSIQGYDVTGADVVVHVTEHLSYHTGQIVLLAKQIADPSATIDFYPQHQDE